MQRVCSFPPVSNAKARILILGSMPGEASLRASQYYAHPRNQFWPIMGELFGAHPSLPYTQRLNIVIRNKIALWEALHSCVRPGSLDSAIIEETPNDFENFLRDHPKITHIFFNGAKAEQSFKRHVRPSLARDDLILTKLPSTSPAHAGRSFQAKLEAWKAVSAALE